MQPFEIEPAHIAQTLKTLRRMFSFTQEALCAASNISVRTIQSIESGKKGADFQTLRSFARAFNVDVGVFRKPNPHEEAKWKEDIERAIRKTAVVPTRPVSTVAEFLNAYGQPNGLNFDMSDIQDPAALRSAAELNDFLQDVLDYWNEASQTERLDMAESIVAIVSDLNAKGCLCHIGSYRQQAVISGKASTIVTVSLVSVRRRLEDDDLRYAIVELGGGWQTVEADRPAMYQGVTNTPAST